MRTALFGQHGTPTGAGVAGDAISELEMGGGQPREGKGLGGGVCV